MPAISISTAARNDDKVYLRLCSLYSYKKVRINILNSCGAALFKKVSLSSRQTVRSLQIYKI